MITIRIKCDVPAKEVVAEISPPPTLGNLRAHICTALELPQRVIHRYSLSVVIPGQDLQLLDGLTESALVDLQPRCTVVARAPLNLRVSGSSTSGKEPRKVLASVSERKEEAAEDHGLAVENVLSKVRESVGDEKELALQYVEMWATVVLESKEFTAVSPSLLTTILERPGLNTSEDRLFDCLLAWGRAHVSKDSTEEAQSALKRVISPYLKYIRLTQMSAAKVGGEVVDFALLEPQLLIELLTYKGLQMFGRPDVTPGALLSAFPTEPRECRSRKSWFRWQTGPDASGVVITNRLVQGPAPGTYVSWMPTVWGNNVAATCGVWEYSIKMIALPNAALQVGWVSADPVNAVWTTGYSWQPQNLKLHRDKPRPYGTRGACVVGAVLRTRLDLNAGTIEYFANGKSQGIAFRNVAGPLRPCVAFSGPTSFELVIGDGD